MKNIFSISIYLLLFVFYTNAESVNLESLERSVIINDMNVDYTVITPDIANPVDSSQPVFVAVTLFYDGVLEDEKFRLYVNNINITDDADISPYYVSYTWTDGIRPGFYDVSLVYIGEDESINISDFSFEVFGDEDEIEITRELAVAVDQYPEFIGGVQSMMNYLGNAIKFPSDRDRRNAENGIVILNYVVKPDGSITNPVVEQSLHEDYDQEVLKVIDIMPDWQPGFQGGRAVSFNYELIVEFQESQQGRSVIIHQPRYLEE